MVQIGLRVPESLHDRLQALADADDRSLAAYVRRIVEQALGEPPTPSRKRPRPRRPRAE